MLTTPIPATMIRPPHHALSTLQEVKFGRGRLSPELPPQPVTPPVRASISLSHFYATLLGIALLMLVVKPLTEKHAYQQETSRLEARIKALPPGCYTLLQPQSDFWPLMKESLLKNQTGPLLELSNQELDCALSGQM
jgi:hypothetical protein